MGGSVTNVDRLFFSSFLTLICVLLFGILQAVR